MALQLDSLREQIPAREGKICEQLDLKLMKAIWTFQTKSTY